MYYVYFEGKDQGGAALAAAERVMCTGCETPALPDCSNWFDRVQDDRGNWEPAGPACKSCGDFCNRRNIKVAYFLKECEKARAIGGQTPFEVDGVSCRLQSNY